MFHGRKIIIIDVHLLQSTIINLSLKKNTPLLSPPSRVIFGGQTCTDCGTFFFPQGTSFLNDIYILNYTSNTDNMTWYLESPRTSARPTARSFHAAASLKNDEVMVICSGQTNSKQLLDDVWIYTFATHTWTMALEVNGAPVFDPAFVKLSQYSFVVIGGSLDVDQQNYSDNVYKFTIDPDTNAIQAYLIDMFDTNGNPSAPQFQYAGSAAYYLESNKDHQLIVNGGQQFIQFASSTSTVFLGCNSGYYANNFSTDPCSPCPQGNYSSQPGQRTCSDGCAAGITTAGTGSSSLSDCSVCEGGFCDHGTCSVSVVDASRSCLCDFGYAGESCSEPVFLIAMLVSFGAIFLTMVGVVVFKKLVARYRAHIQSRQVELELKEHLLSEISQELIDMELGWQVREK